METFRCKELNCQKEIDPEQEVRHNFDIEGFELEIVCPNCGAVYLVDFYVEIAINDVIQTKGGNKI